MPQWLPAILIRIRILAAAHRVSFTLKARQELAALPLALDETDACDVLTGLTSTDSAGRLRSASTGEWMYLFKPTLAGMVMYLKLVVRNDCIVVSFHEDEGGHRENNP
jgi:hypothetical protein